MGNLYTVFCTIIGTFICSQNPDVFVNDIGDYDYSVGFVLAVFLYGLLCLFDTAFSFVKYAIKISVLKFKIMRLRNKQEQN